MKVSYYSSFKNVTPVNYPEIKNVIEVIKKGSVKGNNFKETILKIRNPANSKSAVNDLKKLLPAIGFAGEFSKRENNSLMEASGLMMLDFDGTTEIPETLKGFRFCSFISPSGTGVKVLIRIPLVKNDAQYKQYFAAIQNKFPSVDKSGKDISRLTYLSWDENIYFNEGAPLWTEKIEPKPEPKPEEKPKALYNAAKVQSNYAKMTIPLKMIQQSAVGNRHDTILKAGKLLGGYIGGGEILLEDVEAIFKREILGKMDAESDFDAQWKTFLDGIKYGKELPIKERDKERKAIKAEFKAEEVYGEIYYTLKSQEADLDDLYNNGNPKGFSTGWKVFDDYYSIRPGFFTIMYGAPFTGKTIFHFCMLVNLSKLHGWVNLILSPETGSSRDVFARLIEIFVGKDITKAFNNQMSREEFESAKKFIDQHFIVIDPETVDADLSTEEFLLYCQIIERKFNVKINTVTIDPLIELRFEGDVRDDIFWGQQLRMIRVQAKVNQWHVFLLTHTIKQKYMGHDQYGNAIFPFPTPSDIVSGQVFWRKGFQILGFYRHIFEAHGPDDTIELKSLGKQVFANSLFIRVQKTKPEGVGKIGEIEFRFYIRHHEFIDPSGEIPRVAPSATSIQPFVRSPLGEKDDDLPDW
ncbi:MAG TPA: BT4734/BF3469 family protein [Smithella sp.]|nr:BT4734/BF3469 family protein [Smithella sp.]